MKKITLNLVKGLLAIVLFTGVSVALSTTGVQTVSEANAAGGATGSGGSASSGSSQAGVSASTVNHAQASGLSSRHHHSQLIVVAVRPCQQSLNYQCDPCSRVHLVRFRKGNHRRNRKKDLLQVQTPLFYYPTPP